MGHKGSNDLKKAKPEYSERAHCLGQSHHGQVLNQWFEDDMEQAIREYHQLVFQYSLLFMSTKVVLVNMWSCMFQSVS